MTPSNTESQARLALRASRVIPSLCLVVLILFVASAATLLLATGAAAQAPSTVTLSIDIEDPDAPDFEHVFVDSNGTARWVATHDVSIEISFVPGEEIYLQTRDAVTFASMSCDGGSLEADAFGVVGIVPSEDVTCTFVVDRSTSLRIVTEVTSDPALSFRYWLIGPGRPVVDIEHENGQATWLPIQPDTRYEVFGLGEPGWVADLECVDDDGGVVIPGERFDLDLRLTEGTQAVCTFFHRFTGTADLTIAFESDVPGALLTLTDNEEARLVQLASGASDQAVVTADMELLYDDVTAGGLDVTGSCTGDGGSLTIDATGIRGELEAGAAAVCTFTATEPPTVPITLTIEGPPDLYQGQVRIAFNNAEATSFVLAPGETWTGEASLGRLTELIVFDLDTSGPRPWALTKFTCLGDGQALRLNRYPNSWAMGGILPDDGTVAAVECKLLARDRNIPDGIFPTVTCLAGHGRIDVNVRNPSVLEATYTLEVGTLAPRVRTVDGRDWWRSPVTGRADGPLSVTLTRDGVTVLDSVVDVACDEAPETSQPEVQTISACRPSGGFVAWQFANPTAEQRGYVIEYDGVANRSTTAQAFGAAVRGVSGRPNGVYNYTIRANGVIIEQSSVTVSCS